MDVGRIQALLQTVGMDDNKNGGPNYLEAWRRFRGFTQEALAEKLDTTSSVISYLEQGERGLSAKWLRRLAVVLETTPGMILDHDPTELDADVIDMWAHAPRDKQRQIAEITRTLLRSGTDD